MVFNIFVGVCAVFGLVLYLTPEKSAAFQKKLSAKLKKDLEETPSEMEIEQTKMIGLLFMTLMMLGKICMVIAY